MKRKTKYKFNSFSLLMALMLVFNLLIPAFGVVFADNEQPSSPNICFFNAKDNPRDSKFNPVDKAGPNSVGTINISSDGKTISGTVESTNGHDIKFIVVDIEGFSNLIYIEESFIDDSSIPYKFSKNISGIDPAQTYTYSAYAYTKKEQGGCFQYDFPIIENAKFPTSSGNVVDNTAPTVSINRVENVTKTSADINVSSNETGKIYHVIKPKSQPVPNSTEVKQGTQLNITSNVQLIIKAANLIADTNYVVYVVAVDESGNTSTIGSKPFKTSGILGELGLNVSAKAKQSNVIIDNTSGVATGEIVSTITPKGSIPAQDQTSRQTPIDVVFVFDKSTSMLFPIEDGLLGLLGPSKFKTAKSAAISAVEKFEDSAIAGDRYALVTFEDTAKVEIGFNGADGDLSAVKSHLMGSSSSLKKELNELSSPPSFPIAYTNYADAFAKANSLFDSSSKPKYIIFLTDGTPTVYVNSKGEKVNSFLNPKKTELVKLHSKEEAKLLSLKGIKLYSIGFEKDDEIDMAFLTEISELTGGTASQSLTDADVERHFLTITNMINNHAIKNIKLKVKIKNDLEIPGTVVVQEAGNVTVDGDYAVINIDDILYNPGVGTPKSFDKSLPLTFSKPGKYVFNDIKLIYTDVEGNTQSVQAAPVTFNVNSSVQPLSAEGGILIVKVSKAISGATLKLYNNKNEVVGTDTANANGTYTFINVKPGTGYYAVQYVGGVDKGKSNAVDVSDIVLSFTSAVPQQILIGDAYKLSDTKYLIREPKDLQATWSSSKQSIIHINHNTGDIIGKATGYADITVTSSGKKATIRIYVRQKGNDDLRW